MKTSSTKNPRNIIKIVWDWGKNKYRAQAQDGGWVRFPVKLRVPNTMYMVDELVPSRGGSYIYRGKIQKVELKAVA